MKKAFLIFQDSESLVDLLTDEQAGKLIKAIFDNGRGESVELDQATQVVFTSIQNAIDRAGEKYEESCARRSAAGKKGSNKRWSKENSEDNNTEDEDCANKMANDSNAINGIANHSNAINAIANDSNAMETMAKIANPNPNPNPNPNKDKKRDVARASTRFTPPSVEEVSAYCKERGNDIDPEQFVDFYSSKGWKVGNASMKDWKSSVRTWERRDRASPTVNAAKPKTQFSSHTQQTYDFDALKRLQARAPTEWNG